MNISITHSLQPLSQKPNYLANSQLGSRLQRRDNTGIISYTRMVK